MTARRTAAAVQRIQELAEAGKTHAEIGEELGMTGAMVGRHYAKVLEMVPLRTVLQRRELQLLRIEHAQQRVIEVLDAEHPYVSEGREVFPVVAWEVGEDGKRRPVYGDKPLQDARPVLQAAGQLVGLLKREAETVGTDAPKRIETVNTHVSAEDLRIGGVLQGLAERNEVARAAIEERTARRREGGAGVVDAEVVAEPLVTVPMRVGAGVAGPRPYGAAERRKRGFGADVDRVAGWDPAALFE